MNRHIQRNVKTRLKEIMGRRPVGSGAADQTLRRAVQIFENGPLTRASLPAAGTKLAALLKGDMPDVEIVRGPRTLSLKHAQTSLIAYETRVIEEVGQTLVSLESHAILLRKNDILFVSGLMPGMTRPHLFERVLERGGPNQTFAGAQLQMPSLWPTVLLMRGQQRLANRGVPITAIITPFANGLFFSSIEKLEGLPPSGPLRAIVDANGTHQLRLRDYYRDGPARVSVMTRTFVDSGKLSVSQCTLRDRLSAFIADFADVVADHDWRWKIGLGETDEAVSEFVRAFRIKVASEKRRSKAYAALEAIITSEEWQQEESRNRENQ
ncbi:hypothetical protein RLEG3_12200 [Rhizobium leguminosarum bv. trifolii WSM1689]|uniref:hypothetical protein n=1 Tax=Rhizobium leguminosarum TaxID=384 RepID=UPI0003E08D64|nr:hypothetical protein [Rhizobium leguminosarum]AHF86625.1 hypothetical protein RLEG3_12200 [Rhizobium leguminosarum bv. trifolii WSM1689]